MPLPVTLDPLECKDIIRHLNSTNNKILNNLHYLKIFTLLEDDYFQERLEQYQTPFTKIPQVLLPLCPLIKIDI